MIQIPAQDFSLADTLACGQAFRWHARNGAHYGFIHNCAVRVRQTDSTLTVETVDSRLTAADVIRYFALDLDLAPILASIDHDAQIHDAVARQRGLRILRQDPWECLASFICSSFNNIARIEGMIERLCQQFGSPLSFNGFRGCSFPPPEAIARAPERRLRELGLGFRAPYLKRTAKMIAEGKLPFEALRRTDYAVTKAALLRCDGVGDKVADCVALFGLEKYEAFPVDVWIERALRYYFRAKTPTPARAHDFARRHFGRYAGWAQQYLYHYVRNLRRAVRSSANLPEQEVHGRSS
jgi:N-glycosylase/DNA lyase